MIALGSVQRYAVYMAKKTMDDIAYEYKEAQDILKSKKGDTAIMKKNRRAAYDEK